jgi:serine/threonine-protein kinase
MPVDAGAEDHDEEPAISGAILGRPSSAKLRMTVLPRRSAGVEPRFRRLTSLRESRFDEVGLVEDRDLDRRVIVKRLHRGAREPHHLLRFADEARLVGRLEHPGIVPIHDVGVDEDGQHYFVAKELQGETLASVIAKLRSGDRFYVEKFGLFDRLRIFASVAEAMSYVHSKGVIHRDLRPENVMIGAHGEVTVVEFGIAKRLGVAGRTPRDPDELAPPAPDRLIPTRLGDLLGTPRYMSPEQAAGRNDELDARSDIFALGLLLAELTLLEHPLSQHQHHSELLAELVARGVDAAALRARSRRAGLPIELQRVILRALEHDRRKRYQSLQELLSDLRRVQSGRVAVRCHVTLLKRSAYESLRWVDRNPLAYTLVFAATALTLLGGVGWGLFYLVNAG